MTQVETPKGNRTIGLMVLLVSSLGVILVALAVFRNPHILWALIAVVIMVTQLSNNPQKAIREAIVAFACNVASLTVTLILGDPVWILLMFVSAIIMVRV